MITFSATHALFVHAFLTLQCKSQSAPQIEIEKNEKTKFFVVLNFIAGVVFLLDYYIVPVFVSVSLELWLTFGTFMFSVK